jgi:hypothetical protein
MKKTTRTDRLANALAEIETLKVQVAALQMQVAALTRPVAQPYQPFVPSPAPTWPPMARPPYEVTCGDPSPPTKVYTVSTLDGMRMTRAIA